MSISRRRRAGKLELRLFSLYQAGERWAQGISTIALVVGAATVKSAKRRGSGCNGKPCSKVSGPLHRKVSSTGGSGPWKLVPKTRDAHHNQAPALPSRAGRAPGEKARGRIKGGKWGFLRTPHLVRRSGTEGHANSTRHVACILPSWVPSLLLSQAGIIIREVPVGGGRGFCLW